MKKSLLLILTLAFTGIIAAQPSGYYDRTNGETGFTLKSTLHDIIDEAMGDNSGQPAHDVQSYDNLWDIYESSDSRVENGNTFVFDMYSNCDFEFVTDQNMGDNGPECTNFNREHSFPRSWFGGSSSLDIFKDPFHVIPTDSRVNGERGNLAYGEVIDGSETYISTNNSKKGPSALQGPTGQVFEPADEFKGDIARQFFYVATRYEDMISGWESNDSDGDSMLDGSSDKVFEDWALNMLFDWHINDPVSSKEMTRQEAIFTAQDNRNPFIDNPDWVQEIWGNVLSTQDITGTEFSMFPNPAQGNSVTFDFNTEGTTDIQVFSILGRKVLSARTEAQRFNLNITDLSTGVYLVKVTQGSSSKTLKLVRR